MKKIGIIIFAFALIAGIIFANFFSFGNLHIKSPISFSFGKIKGSGNYVTEKREVSNFKNVEVNNIFEVEIVAQKEFSIEVDADDNLLEFIKTEVSGDTLKIENDKKFSTKNRVKIRITTPDIENLDVSGASTIRIADLNNQSLKIDTSGASSVKVEGKTNRLVIDASGASRVDTKGLSASNVSVDASGASRANINVSEILNVDLSGASNVTYSGNPGEINKKTSGASSIRQMN